MKGFMYKSYKNNSPKTPPSKKEDIRMEGTVDVSDHHFTIED
jgi:hypothetical protein